VKGAGGLLVVVLIAVVVLYYMQSGSPDTSGLGDAADRLKPTDAGGALEKGADTVADGARTGADKTATGIVPWIAGHPLVVAAGVLAAFGIAFYRRHKVMSLVIGAAAIGAFIASLAT
jgi:hypothetical protein